MDADQVRDLRLQMAMSQEQFADLLGVSRRTVGNWERGRPIQPSSERRLRELVDTLALGEGVEAEEVSLADEVAELRERVDYLEAIVMRDRADELAQRRDQKGLSVPPRNLRAVADSNRDADAEGEANQEEP